MNFLFKTIIPFSKISSLVVALYKLSEALPQYNKIGELTATPSPCTKLVSSFLTIIAVESKPAIEPELPLNLPCSNLILILL